jgi:hypothetical protein
MLHTMDSLGLTKGFSSPSGCMGDATEEAFTSPGPGIDTVRRGAQQAASRRTRGHVCYQDRYIHRNTGSEDITRETIKGR